MKKSLLKSLVEAGFVVFAYNVIRKWGYKDGYHVGYFKGKEEGYDEGSSDFGNFVMNELEKRFENHD